MYENLLKLRININLGYDVILAFHSSHPRGQRKEASVKMCFRTRLRTTWRVWWTRPLVPSTSPCSSPSSENAYRFILVHFRQFGQFYLLFFIFELYSCGFCKTKLSSWSMKYRGIYFAKYFGGGGGVIKMAAGEKN